MEWNNQKPRVGERRIRRKFAFLPQRGQQNRYVWLDYYYLFEIRERSRPSMDCSSDGWWRILTILTPTQLDLFKQDLSLHLTGEDNNAREFAKLLQAKF